MADFEVDSFVTETGRHSAAWRAKRAAAQSKARVTLQLVSHDLVKGGRLWRVQYRRFAWCDYSPKRATLSIFENARSIGFRLQSLNDGKWTTDWAYILSFKRKRPAFYRMYAKDEAGGGFRVKHYLPHQLDIMAPIKERYPAAEARFSKRLIKLIRSKARQCKVRGLPPVTRKHDNLAAFIMDVVFPSWHDLESAGQPALSLGVHMGNPSQPTRMLMRIVRAPLHDVVKRATGYGSKAVTKAFWGGIKDSGWNTRVAWTYTLRQYLPVDYTQKLLASPSIHPFHDRCHKVRADVRRILLTFSPKRLLNLLTAPLPTPPLLEVQRERGETLADAAEALEHLRKHKPGGFVLDRQFATFKEVHDYLVRERRKLTEPDFELKEAEATAERKERDAKLAAIHGRLVEVGEHRYVITVPKMADELRLWGESMGNCIGGYAKRVASGDTIILGLLDVKSVCQWGIEISPHSGQITQFRGRFNADAPQVLHEAMRRLLIDAKVVSTRVLPPWEQPEPIEVDEEAAVPLVF